MKKLKSLCQENDCNTRASFNYIGKKYVAFCSKHKKPTMINVNTKKCVKCLTSRPSFGIQGRKATHCGTCKEINMVDVVHRKCLTCKLKIPCFNFKSEKRPLYCFDCKLTDMINVIDNKCIKCNMKIPSFCKENEIKATHCGTCKDDSMIDVVHGKCIICKTVQASYNIEGKKIKLYCNSCKLPNMIDVVNKFCIKCNKVRPCFNFKSKKTATHCSSCKEEGMINIKDKMCIKCNNKRPSFNYESENSVLYCFDCKEPNMIDIKCKKCTICNKRASYGIPHNQPTRCAIHKTVGMILKPRSRCIYENCSELAEYGIFKPIHCFTHKQSEDINLVERLCVRCDRLDVVNNDGICVNFCMKDDEYNIYKKRLKRKEKRVYDIVQEKCGVFDYCNQTIVSRCYKDDLDKPDCGYDCKTHDLYIECDENQHKDRCPKIEFERMINVYHQLEGKPVIFIRYNPDRFNFLSKSKSNLSQRKREEILINWVNFFRTVEPYNGVYVLYLFYDNNEIESYTKEMAVDPYNKNDFPELWCENKDCCRCVD